MSSFFEKTRDAGVAYSEEAIGGYEGTMLLAAIVESSEDAIIGESLEGVITSWNTGAVKMFGYSSEDVLGKSVAILHAPEDEAEVFAILTLIRDGKGPSHFEAKRRRKDGAEIEVSISVSPIRGEDGEIIGAAKIFRDITDRKRAAELTLRAEKLEVANRLAASVAHEINNPLCGLTNLLYLMKGEEMSERASGLLSAAERELARVTHVTAQALGFYKEQGSPSLHQVSGIVEQAIALHLHRMEEGQVQLEKTYEDVVPIACHAGEVKQVFVNLIGNALDAVNGDGRLVIRVRPGRSRRTSGIGVNITIADSGPGIAEEAMGRLFEPFNTTRGKNRTGLGLWMGQQIVMRHRGEMKVKTSGKKKLHGTVVRIFLPCGEGA
ncbi:MAG: PAS domain S-box protein [Acidobacteriaceae bacterium]